MVKEKLLGTSVQLKASKRMWSEPERSEHKAAPGSQQPHVLQRIPLLGTHGVGREEALLTLYLLHVSFNPSRNKWCPLKASEISLAGAKTLSPSEMPQRLSIYNTPGCSKSCRQRSCQQPCTGKQQLQEKGGNCGGDPEAGKI